MTIDLTKITPYQANRIECVLNLLHHDFTEHIEAANNLASSTDLPEQTRKTFASNVEWLKEAYLLIYGKEYTR